MERPAMFLQFLLVLLVAIQVTFACQCNAITLGKAMCNANKTVILARVLDGGELLDEVGNLASAGSFPAGTKYLLYVQRVFQEGIPPLSLNNSLCYMIFPQHGGLCGGVLTEGMDYVIAGDVGSDGVLYSNTCNHIVPYEYIVLDQHVTGILQGEVDCANV